MEKIIDCSLDLPIPPINAIRNATKKQLRYLLKTDDKILDSCFDSSFGNFKTLRAAKRFITQFETKLLCVKDVVDPLDFVALETLRTISPEIYRKLHNNILYTDFCLDGARPWLFKSLGFKHESTQDIKEKLTPHLQNTFSLESTDAKIITEIVLFLTKNFYLEGAQSASQKSSLHFNNPESHRNYFTFSDFESPLKTEDRKELTELLSNHSKDDLIKKLHSYEDTIRNSALQFIKDASDYKTLSNQIFLHFEKLTLINFEVFFDDENDIEKLNTLILDKLNKDQLTHSDLSALNPYYDNIHCPQELKEKISENRKRIKKALFSTS